ncbi:MAG: RnfABCDGE type electron transport complex subunit D [Bacillota bacterium]|nr:RnfABCDGE type electron transport complex subunit D [Bacillota bacterium]
MAENGAQNELLVVSSSPHVKTRDTTQRLMGDVLIGLAPAAAAAGYLFGSRALMIMAASVGTAVLAEHLVSRMGHKRTTIGDLSAAVTGLLLAFNLPPSVPPWIPVIGSAVAILLVKALFGGLGGNFLNPALAARAILLAAWPVHMTAWIRPFDLVGTATPLATLVPKGVAGVPLPSYLDMFLGRIPGSLGETSALALLAGGLYLLWRRVIDWHTPVAFVGTVFVLTWLLGPDGIGTGDPLAHVLSGGLMLGALFMATDYVTSPVTPRGRLVMGLGCGLLTVLIRIYGAFPEGVSYSILIMNVATPLIDRWMTPRKFGMVKTA